MKCVACQVVVMFCLALVFISKGVLTGFEPIMLQKGAGVVTMATIIKMFHGN